MNGITRDGLRAAYAVDFAGARSPEADQRIDLEYLEWLAWAMRKDFTLSESERREAADKLDAVLIALALPARAAAEDER